MTEVALEEGALFFAVQQQAMWPQLHCGVTWCPWLTFTASMLRLLVGNVSFAALLGLCSMIVVNGMGLWDGAWVLAKVGLKGA